jgi:hypothetical protein
LLAGFGGKLQLLDGVGARPGALALDQHFERNIRRIEALPARASA